MRRPLTLGLAVGTLACALAGCAYSEGGPGASVDQHTYVSTSWRPVTVSVLDSRTGQTFWSVDVPVGKMLVIAFRKDQGGKGEVAPDMMRWEIMDPDNQVNTLSNTLAVPDRDSRRIDTKLRPAPELPPDMGGGIGKGPGALNGAAKPAR